MSLLRVEELSVSFYTREGTFRAVSDVSFEVAEGETVAFVGESGCGKTVTALALLGLIPPSAGKVEARRLEFRGKDLQALSRRELRGVRGGEIAMVFQEPSTALNPVFRIGTQLVETILQHREVSEREARRLAAQALEAVGVPDAETCLRAYPHELSGGLRQRVLIAMAVACQPSLLIADEPTTALDVTIQAQILDLLRRLQEERRMAILLITHDLGVVAEMAHRVMVMYAGEIVESALVGELFERPRHPYTQGLLRSMPALAEDAARLTPIEGTVPDLGEWGEGCRFSPRCPWAFQRCYQEAPALLPVTLPTHWARCFALPKANEVYFPNEPSETEVR